MSKPDEKIKNIINQLYRFRSVIPANLTVKKVKEVWDVNFEEKKLTRVIEPRKNIIKEKMNIARESMNIFLLPIFVKFVGVSGSVGSEFAKKEDDIDLFIVTKNDTVWIYRILLYIKNLFSKKIRSKGDKDVKDKFCINFLVEERALEFEDDIFNLNELLYLKPLYNKRYLPVIFLNNSWLKDKYFVSNKFLKRESLKVGDIKNLKKRKHILIPINFIAFIMQFVYMLITDHKPDLKRLLTGFKKGRVEFYPKSFKENKMKDL